MYSGVEQVEGVGESEAVADQAVDTNCEWNARQKVLRASWNWKKRRQPYEKHQQKVQLRKLVVQEDDDAERIRMAIKKLGGNNKDEAD